MTTELVGQAQEVEDSNGLAEATPHIAQPSPHLANRLGESVFRVSERVGVNLAWVEAWIRCGQVVDVETCSESELDRAVKVALRIVDHTSEGASERLARTYSL